MISVDGDGYIAGADSSVAVPETVDSRGKYSHHFEANDNPDDS